MKFVIYFDYFAGQTENGYKYESMKAETIEEAIDEANEMRKADPNKIYLTRIMKKVGRSSRVDGCTVETFEAVLCKRFEDWHRNITENGEAQHTIDRWTQECTNNTYVWFE